MSLSGINVKDAHEGWDTMIIRMVAWLDEHGYDTHGANPEGVIWAIDRVYPGGFNRFVRTNRS